MTAEGRRCQVARVNGEAPQGGGFEAPIVSVRDVCVVADRQARAEWLTGFYFPPTNCQLRATWLGVRNPSRRIVGPFMYQM